MSEAADDAYDAAMRQQETLRIMLEAGCKRCPEPHGDHECPICLDLGWLDKDGNPCES